MTLGESALCGTPRNLFRWRCPWPSRTDQSTQIHTHRVLHNKRATKRPLDVLSSARWALLLILVVLIYVFVLVTPSRHLLNRQQRKKQLLLLPNFYTVVKTSIWWTKLNKHDSFTGKQGVRVSHIIIVDCLVRCHTVTEALQLTLYPFFSQSVYVASYARACVFYYTVSISLEFYFCATFDNGFVE